MDEDFRGRQRCLVGLNGIAECGSGCQAFGTAFFGVIGEGPTGEKFLKPAIIEANSQEFKDLDCESITTLS